MRVPSLYKTNKLLKTFPINEKTRYALLSFAIGKIVPFFGTASLKIQKLENNNVELKIKNKRKVKNHMGGIHASAIGLLAEAASGLALMMNLPANAKFSTTFTQAEYSSKAKGSIRALVNFSEEDINIIKNNDKGSLKIPVHILDSNNTSPANFLVEWSWKK